MSSKIESSETRIVHMSLSDFRSQESNISDNDYIVSSVRVHLQESADSNQSISWRKAGSNQFKSQISY